jgi:hypothetical protein
LFYAATLYMLVGVLIGSLFKVRSLLLVLPIIVIEALVFAILHGSIAGFWAIASLAAVQVGYLAGVCCRCMLEEAGVLHPYIGPRRAR